MYLLLGIHLLYSFCRNIHVLDTFRRKFKHLKAYKNKTQPTDLSIDCVLTCICSSVTISAQKDTAEKQGVCLNNLVIRRYINMLQQSILYCKHNFESGCYPILPFVTRCFSLGWAHFGHKTKRAERLNPAPTRGNNMLRQN